MENLRLSYYTIPVKLENDNKYLLVHGYTGAIDLIDESLWMQIKDYPLKTNIKEETVNILKNRGYITVKTLEEEQDYVIKMAQILHKAQAKLHKFWGIIITYDCNFRCPYCFENEISHNGCQWSRASFTKEMADKAFEAMLKIEPHRNLHKNEILLYGGEPLLRENKSIVSYIIDKGISLGYKFKVITNGYDLEYYEDIISNNKNFTSFQVSIDGCKEYHNSRKSHFIEGDSFDKIVQNIGLLLKHKNKVFVRVNLDNNNLHDYEKLKVYFEKIGYAKNSNFYLNPARLLDPIQENDTNLNINYLSRNEYINGLEESSSLKLPTQDFGICNKFYSYFINKRRCCLTSTSCPAQYGSFLFDPLGNIYPCLEVVGKQKYSIGQFIDSVEWTSVKDTWYNTDISNILMCAKCKFALLCGGICPAKIVAKGVQPSCKNYHSIFSKSINYAYNTYLKKNEYEKD